MAYQKWINLPVRQEVEGLQVKISPAVKDLNTPRKFPPIGSKAEWVARAREIREQALVSCGLWPMPEKTPLNARVFGKVERDGYTIEKVALETFPGFYLGGNLYRPLGKGRGPFPGILNPHGHWSNGRMADEKGGSQGLWGAAELLACGALVLAWGFCARKEKRRMAP